MDIERFLRKGIFILWLTACEVPLQWNVSSINKSNISFIFWFWNVTSHIEGIPCFEEPCERSYQENIWPVEGVNDRRTQKII